MFCKTELCNNSFRPLTIREQSKFDFIICKTLSHFAFRKSLVNSISPTANNIFQIYDILGLLIDFLACLSLDFNPFQLVWRFMKSKTNDWFLYETQHLIESG